MKSYGLYGWPGEWPGNGLRRSAAIVLSLLLLAGCGGLWQRAPEGGKAPGKTVPAQKRGGGYYQDDGPADAIPVDLDALPDAQPKPELLHRFANKPYVVLGKTYEPNTRIMPYKERGVASWYGKKFHGQKTSVGEPYDMFAMTAAHPVLAIPCYVRVTNLANGRSVIVRVNDRGPFHADRLIDLSYAAAYKLGYVNQGSTPVEVEALVFDEGEMSRVAAVSPPAVNGVSSSRAQAQPVQPQMKVPQGEKNESVLAVTGGMATAPVSATPALVTGTYLQLGAFANADNAEALRLRLQRDLEGVREPIRVHGGTDFYRVFLGPYATRQDAEQVAGRILQTHGFKPTIVQR